MPVIKWTFTEVDSGTSYEFEINPSEGGSPVIDKQLAVATAVGPRRTGILQEGATSPPEITFSGVILTQTQYEAMETWFDKRLLLQLDDDLGRTFTGVFSGFEPRREYRAQNFWFHRFNARFIVWKYINASGAVIYGGGDLTPSTSGTTGTYGTVIGNGSSTEFPVTHNLGSEDVIIQVFRASDPKSRVYPIISIDDANSISVDFVNYVPTSNQFNVVVSYA